MPDARKGLVDIGTCNLHVYHNGFQKGLQTFGFNVSELVIDIKLRFKLSDAIWEDYQSIQLKLELPAHKFLKHVDSRWLTLGPASSRVIKQSEGIKHYFLNEIPKQAAEKLTNSKQQKS